MSKTANITGEESTDQLIKLRSEGSAKILTMEALICFLERFQFGSVGTDFLEFVANEMENEHVDYEPGKEQAIATVLFEISSSEINGRITLARSKELLSQLKREKE
jgi:hypothetical protein